MRRRLRQKNTSALQELGLEMDGDLHPAVQRAAVHAFTDRFIAHVAARELAFGCGIGTTIGGFVIRSGRGSATNEDRASVAAFLATDPDVCRRSRAT